MDCIESSPRSGMSPISRRTLAVGAAWSIPGIAIASAAPAFAASGSSPATFTVVFTGGLQMEQMGPYVDLGTIFSDTTETDPSAHLRVCESGTANCVQFDSTASPGTSQTLTLSGAEKTLDVIVDTSATGISTKLRADRMKKSTIHQIYVAAPDYDAAYYYTDPLLTVEPAGFNSEETGTTTDTFSNGGTVYLVTTLTMS